MTYSIELMPYSNFLVNLYRDGKFCGSLWAWDLRLPISQRDEYYSGCSEDILAVFPILTDELKELGLIPM
jgi:hypothetical protein